MYKTDKSNVVVFGERTVLGGGKSACFALIYDSLDALKSFEPRYRQTRLGLLPKREGAGRKLRKERKVGHLESQLGTWLLKLTVIKFSLPPLIEPCKEGTGYKEGQGCHRQR